MRLDKNHQPLAKKQRGFLIPLAIFIIIVMGGLALVISRTSTQAQTSSVLEMMNIQAFYAAESGAQRGMQVLFFPNAEFRQGVDNRCAGLNQMFTFDDIAGLRSCTAQVTCVCRYSDNAACSPATAANYLPNSAVAVTTSFYTLTSIASCGSLPLRAERTIQAGAFLRQE